MPSTACAKWGTPLEATENKKILNRISGMSLNEELMLNYEEEDKESEKLH